MDNSCLCLPERLWLKVIEQKSRKMFIVKELSVKPLTPVLNTGFRPNLFILDEVWPFFSTESVYSFNIIAQAQLWPSSSTGTIYERTYTNLLVF